MLACVGASRLDSQTGTGPWHPPRTRQKVLKPPSYNTQARNGCPPRDMTIDFPSQVPTVNPIFPGLLAGICAAREQVSPRNDKVAVGSTLPLMETAASPDTTTVSGQVRPGTYFYDRWTTEHIGLRSRWNNTEVRALLCRWPAMREPRTVYNYNKPSSSRVYNWPYNHPFGNNTWLFSSGGGYEYRLSVLADEPASTEPFYEP